MVSSGSNKNEIVSPRLTAQKYYLQNHIKTLVEKNL
jgi:hypothetical protein